MVLAMLRGQRLNSFILGTKACPPEFITTSNGDNTDSSAQLVSNPAYEEWYAND